MFDYLNSIGDRSLEMMFNSYATNIYSSGLDTTSEYTLKALLHKRAGGRYVETYCLSLRVHGTDDANISRSILNNISFDRALTVIYVDGDKDEYNRAINATESDVSCLGFIHNEAAERFMAQNNLDTRIYINEKRKTSLIIGHPLSAKSYHALQSLIPVLLPWYFKDNPVTDDEKALLTCLLSDTSDAYKDWMCKFIKSLDLRTSMIRNKLDGYTSRLIEERTRSIMSSIEDYDKRIREHEQLINTLMANKDKLNDELTGFLLRENPDKDDTLIDFLIASKSIFLQDVFGSDIYIEVATTLDNFDADMYEKFRENPRSPFNLDKNFYSCNSEDGKRLLDAIFIKQSLKINVRASFILNFINARGNVNRDYTDFSKNCINNPHLTEYRCLGNNNALLFNALRKRDYMIALSTCISIAGNLNVSEVPNVEHFMRYIFEYAYRDGTNCIKLPDGTDVSVSEAIEYIKKGEANE